MPPTPPSPRWYAIPVRVLLYTFLGTLISFAVSLLTALVGTVAVAAYRGTDPNIAVAYRGIALPAAIIAGMIVFVLALPMEIRHYFQSKALAEIAKHAENAI